MNKKIIVAFIAIILLAVFVYGGQVIIRNGQINATDIVSVGTTMYVDSGTGNVGIGTGSPGAKFDVTGGYARITYASGPYLDFYHTNGNTNQKFTRIGSYNGSITFEGVNDAYSTPTEYMRINASGKVGIGTSSPDSTLHVIGGACVEAADSNCAQGAGNLKADTITAGTQFSGPGTGLTGTAASLKSGTATALAANGANCGANSFPLGVDASGAVESCSTSISGNAATATALAANGANCGANTFPLGVDANGAVESCSNSISGNAATATNADTTDGYHMNQALLTTSTPTFGSTTITGTLGNWYWDPDGSTLYATRAGAVYISASNGAGSVNIQAAGSTWLSVGSGGGITMQAIYANTVTSPRNLYISAAGALGGISSSIRFKQNVSDMGNASEKLYDLRPVTFIYKNSTGVLEYGMIAEEMEKVYPELVYKDDQNLTSGIAYDRLPAIELNELIKHKKSIDELDKKTDANALEIKELRQLNLQKEAEINLLKDELCKKDSTYSFCTHRGI